MGGSGPKLTADQSKDAFYFIKGDGANANLQANEGALTSLGDQAANAVPFIGNYFTADGFKNANRDAKEFLAAVLRKESGGAITQDEWGSYGPMYIPAPGDGPDQITRKRAARDRAMAALKATAGPGKVVIDEYLKQNPRQTISDPQMAPVKLSLENAAAEWAALPSGTQYIDPQGNVRTKG